MMRNRLNGAAPVDTIVITAVDNGFLVRVDYAYFPGVKGHQRNFTCSSAYEVSLEIGGILARHDEYHAEKEHQEEAETQLKRDRGELPF